MVARTVVVTGASSGIGRAVALRFARDGARVALASRTQEDVDRVATAVEAAGGAALAVATDVADRASVAAFAARVKDEWGHVDVLVNNAGVGRDGGVEDASDDDWDEQIATNLTGVHNVTRAFLPLILATGDGVIVNVASVLGKDSAPGLAGYTASKFGVRGLSLSMAEELSPKGVRVTCLMPGYVATPMVAGAAVAEKDMVQPQDLADVVAFLADAPPSILIDELPVWPRRLYADG